ncbi:YlqD family protein [Peptococcaceae bacterium]|jgi:exonuclease VII small subunit|nr:YlqD family protein [Peptococcaceae bacterium]MCL0100664.1 YlqD family protein [Peptococcaceae bacterium]
MQSITITRPVSVKVKVTDGYKKRMVSELHKSIQILESEIRHLEIQMKKFKSSNENYKQVEQHIKNEINIRMQRKQDLLQKIKAIGQLKNGTEVVHGRVESLVELKVGDDWNEVMNVEIVVESGKVIEIRSGVL